ncbi:anthranilate phosphoribosyltransferase [Synchytrium microbalum]|uniref:Anthranilate phosphoribosyltransferase n=1 Tax=Synchytrium microbalum TaxID=1806994 RepID=A0A507BY98_9FUNG|nr:anthranilate phosphoribosyltransferase [Synchytrium microbalum]TPX33767.1 anthranilate phosphoribosyltransferase [Synchytrium microbalum]
MQAILKTLIQTPSSFTPSLAHDATNLIMTGQATASQIGAFLIAIKLTNLETNPAIVAAIANAMRDAALRIAQDDNWNVCDVVGTGGDGQDTFNVSTATGIVCAGAGCRVAKHGNRAASSKCGSADVLEEMGASLLSITPESVPSLVKEDGGFCFLFAQAFHPAMKHVAAARKEIGVRTIFNLLGPLSNPARPKRVVVGVASQDFGKAMAEALALTGVERAWVVNGSVDGTNTGGLDELSPAGPTHVWSLENNKITEFTVTPLDFGLEIHPLSSVVGGDRVHNGSIMKDLLAGRLPEGNPVLDFVLLNSAALLFVDGKAGSYKEGVEMARRSILEGKAKKALDAFVSATEKLKEDALAEAVSN